MSDINTDLRSIIEYFYKWEKETPNNVFLRQPYGDTWKEWTYAQAGKDIRRMATALQKTGLPKGSHIGLISKNCAHWIITDFAIIMAGYISVPFYANLTADQLGEVVRLGDVEAIFVGKLDHWDEQKDDVLEDIKVMRFPHFEGNAKISIGTPWDDLIANNEPIEDSYVPDLNSLWTILFTSGTTGTPKGVMHNFSSSAYVMRNQEINNDFSLTGSNDQKFFSFLPLNHIAERVVIEIGCMLSGGSVSFAETLDSFVKNLKDTSPSVFFAVPRIWTKFHLGVLAKMPQEKMDKLLGIPIIGGLVKKKILKGLGLQNVKTALTGAALTPEPLKQWYRKLGVNLREAYGLTENMGSFCAMPEFEYQQNSVGKPLGFSEGRIDPKTGELQIKQPWIMQGYYKAPELSEKVLQDGWFHTGDKGEIDEKGFVRIIGRVGDTFKTTKGEFIIPTNIEDHFNQNEMLEQVCVVGIGLTQPVILGVLSEIGQAADKAAVTKRMEENLKQANSELQPYEKLATLVVVSEEWDVENSLMTPTLKVRRSAVMDHYRTKLSDWHDSKDNVIWE